MTRFILVAILLLLLAWAFWRLMDGIIETLGGTSRSRAQKKGPRPVKLVRDPVCGTFVQPSESLALSVKGATHYFCSKECREKFARS